MPAAFGQAFDPVRASLRESLHDSKTAESLAGLILLSDEFELSGARYWINNDAETRLTSFALPYRKTFFPWADPAPGIYFEGVLGYAQAHEFALDIYQGQLPGGETSVDSRWTTFGGLLGLGPQFQLAEGLSLAVIANGGGGRLQNDASFGGPGAVDSAQLLNGLVFNWDGYIVSGGGALRLDWQRPLGESCQLQVATRYDMRWTKTVEADDAALEFTSRAQFFTFRADVVGPTGWDVSGNPLMWRSTTGCRAFLEGDMYTITAMGLIGGALELDTDDVLPLGPMASLSAAFLFGNRMVGYTVGLGLSF